MVRVRVVARLETSAHLSKCMFRTDNELSAQIYTSHMIWHEYLRHKIHVCTLNVRRCEFAALGACFKPLSPFLLTSKTATNISLLT